MVCDGCSSRVEEVLGKLTGVRKVTVDLDAGLATVEVEAAGQLDSAAALAPLVAAVIELGFDAAPVEA